MGHDLYIRDGKASTWGVLFMRLGCATLDFKKMGTLLFWLALILLPVKEPLQLFAEGPELDLVALAKRIRPAVLLLTVMDSNGKQVALGTGFLVSTDGMLITNHHVIKDGKQITAKAENGAYFLVDGLLADDPINDLVILKLQGKDFPFLILGESGNIDAGTRVAVIGSPLGLEGSLSEGIVSAIRHDMGGGRLLQITAAVSQGSSGSPVLQSDGKVVGAATAMLGEGQSLNFAVPVEAAKALLMRAQAAVSPFPFKDKKSDDDYWYFNDPEYKITFTNTSDPVKKLKLAQLLADRYPQSPWAYLNLGQIYLDLHFASEGVKAFQKSIQLKSDFDGAWSLLCEAYRISNSKTDAVDACQQAVKLNPDKSYHWFFLGQAYKESRRQEDSIAAFQKAVGMEPSDIDAWVALGDAYYSLYRYSDQIFACQKATALNSNSSEAWLCLGRAYKGSRQYKEAIAALERAVTLDPQNAEAWESLALTLSAAGKHDRASKALKELEKLNPKMAGPVAEILLLNTIGDSLR